MSSSLEFRERTPFSASWSHLKDDGDSIMESLIDLKTFINFWIK